MGEREDKAREAEERKKKKVKLEANGNCKVVSRLKRLTRGKENERVSEIEDKRVKRKDKTWKN